jgi:hypothetical protein
MSETPSNEPLSATEDTTESVAAPAAAPVATHATSHAARPSKLPFWLAVAALVLAILAVAGAAYGYFYPNESAAAAGKYSDQQRSDARKHVCETFSGVEHELLRSTHFKLPPDAGPAGQIAALTFQQFAFFSGGAVLRDRLDQEPATSSELAKPAGEVATGLQALAVGVIGGAKDFAQQELRQDIDAKLKAVAEVCKKEAAK